MAATIGIAAGVHANLLALGATLLTLAILVVLSWIERGVGTRADGEKPRRRRPDLPDRPQ
jgi:uncharacterized membrane protein YhiD involved in acid resistance